MSFSSFDDSEKERIREAIDIVDLVEHHYAIPLRRAGRKFKGRCPWHDDHDPSLTVDPDRQTFMCYPCQIGGDVFSFVMAYEKVDFKEAMEILAERAGIELRKKPAKKYFIRTGPNPAAATAKTPATDDPNALLDQLGQDDDGAEQSPPSQFGQQYKEVSKDTLLKAAEWVAGLYHKALLTLDEAAEARKYLEERGINEESIKRFQIGFAPQRRGWLVDRADRKPERIQILETIGNLKCYGDANGFDASKYFDPFHGRLMFPIRDNKGKTVGFSGRTVPNVPLKNPAKYYNTGGESPLFFKARLVYGLDLARRTMSSGRRALIMEGYTDVIMAHQYGFGEAVAVMGVALGVEHIRELRRYVDRMILILDGDAAGMRNADRVLSMFVAQGIDMQIVTIPEGGDPCEFLQAHGAEAFETLLKTGAVDALEHAIQTAARGIDVRNDVAGSVKALDSLIELIAQAPVKGTLPNDPIRLRIEKTVQTIAHRFLTPVADVRRRLEEKRRRFEDEQRKPQRTDAAEAEGTAAPKADWFSPEQLPDRLEKEMLQLWLTDPTAIYEFWEAVPVERYRSPLTRMVYEKCNEIIERNKPATFERLLAAFDENPKMSFYLVELYNSGREKRKGLAASPDDADEAIPVFSDEVSELEESLRSETEEQRPLPPEVRERLIREIIEGFDRRDEPRRMIDDMNRLGDDSLTKEEKFAGLLELQAELRRQQEEKRKRLGINEE